MVHIDGSQLSENYKEHLSNFHEWEQKDHCEKWIQFPNNLGEKLCLDETSLSQGEVSTILTNAEAKTQKGCLISIIDGTKSSEIIDTVSKIPLEERLKVKEVSVDMANNMEKAAKQCFPNAKVVTDRFHVAKLVSDAVQDIRVGYRWEAIDEENENIKKAKKNQGQYVPETYSNGDTKKQLLARSRYLLFKSKSKWSKSQKERARILFKEFPSIEKAYKLSMTLRNIYETCESPDEAEESYEKWKKSVYTKIYAEEKETDRSETKKDGKIKKHRGLNVFQTVMSSIENHKETILNFFRNRSTNALAECFNSKLKSFRNTFRGVRDLEYFLYRVSILYS